MIGAREIGRALHSHTDAALSRIKLLQLASLPDAQAVVAAKEWTVEVPLLLGQQMAMMQFQISGNGGGKARERKRGWQMRFAVNLSEIGEVGAEIGLNEKSVSVSLWADNPDTAEVLREMLPELAESLASIGLDPGAVLCRTGAPVEAKPASSHLIDSFK